MTNFMNYDIMANDPCYRCAFASTRPDRCMFERPYVCLNKERINDIVNRCKILIDAERLKEACHLLDKASTMKSTFDDKGFIEPDDSLFTPYCYVKTNNKNEKDS